MVEGVTSEEFSKFLKSVEERLNAIERFKEILGKIISINYFNSARADMKFNVNTGEL